METREDMAKLAFDFVLQCYFGDMSEPIDAAINRAYIDMASHTLKGFGEDYEKKWECRYNASQSIKEALEDLDMEKHFDNWHTALCDKIQEAYTDIDIDFTYGQAQKWVNMTTKYLLVFDLIYDYLGDAEQRDKLPQFFQGRDNVQKLHIPLDNYLLLYYKKSKLAPWSRMDKDAYNACRKELKEKTIEDELEDWSRVANAHRTDDTKSYAYYAYHVNKKRTPTHK